MTDRYRVLRQLVRISNRNPDLRICQIIGNAVPPEEAKKRNNDIYYIEDADLLKWLEAFAAHPHVNS